MESDSRYEDLLQQHTRLLAAIVNKLEDKESVDVILNMLLTVTEPSHIIQAIILNYKKETK